MNTTNNNTSPKQDLASTSHFATHVLHPTPTLTHPPNDPTTPATLSTPTQLQTPILLTTPTTTTTTTTTNQPQSPSKNARYHATPTQLKHLHQVFSIHPSPPAEVLHTLSLQLGMPLSSLVFWFKNRRARSGINITNKMSVITRTGKKRKYVKSGIYSKIRNGRGVAGGGNDGLGYFVGFGGDEEEGRERERDGEGDGRGGRVKGGFVGGCVELLGDDNPCGSWDAGMCERVCLDFVRGRLGGMVAERGLEGEVEACLELVRVVGNKFFHGEMQNGVTLTSQGQSLDSALEVLEGCMRDVYEPQTGERLKSGVRAVLREFVVQIRNGKAVEVAIAPPVS